MSKKRNIPQCPVEMTLQLIGDKWKVLIIRDLFDRNETVQRTDALRDRNHAESPDQQSALYGSRRTGKPESLPSGPSESRIFSH